MVANTPPPGMVEQREMDPRATAFTGGHFALFDLYRANIQSGGGAVLEGTHFDGVDFGPSGGDLRNILFRPLSGQRAIGAIPVRNCTFTNCRFHTLGITGSEDLLRMLIEQVRTTG